MPQKIRVTEEMWEKIKVDYVSSEISIRGVARKYGVPYNRVRNRAEAEDWVGQRKNFEPMVVQKSLEIIADQKAEECAKAFRVAATILDKIEAIVAKIDEDNPDALKDIKSATSAIKDLKEIGLFRAELDRQEQMARINKLRKDAEEEEKDTTVTVVFENMDDYAE